MMLLTDVIEWLQQHRPIDELIESVVVPQLMNLPEGMQAGAILADPPIAFEAYSAKGEGRAPQKHYGCMIFEELAAMPIASITAPDCFLFLWIPPRSVFLVKPLMEAWGFKFSGKAFCWAKTTSKAIVTPLSVTASSDAKTPWHFGNGYGTRHNTEDCWLGRRGSPERKSKAVRELIVAPVREHSRKPDEIYERIEALCDGPYVELFARQQWAGWTCVGNESEKFTAAAA